MLAAYLPDQRRRRKSVLETALERGGMEYTPIHEPVGDEQ
jgi:hypothetical protein